MSRVLKEEAAQGKTNTTVGPIRWMVRNFFVQRLNHDFNAFDRPREYQRHELRSQIRCLDLWRGWCVETIAI